MSELAAIFVAIACIVVGLLLLASMESDCEDLQCPAGLHAELMMKHRYVYKCVCVMEPQ